MSPSWRTIRAVPRLWNETIEAHRQAVSEAILDTTAALVAEHGLRAVTMSQIAEQAGIGRATLYKYFPDVEAILIAWHERHVGAHLHEFAQIRDQAAVTANERLRSVLETYALIQHDHYGSELAALLHQGPHLEHAQRRLGHIIRDLIAEGANTGEFRADVNANELANYCLHALTGAAGLPSKTAARRLVTVTLAGLDPPH
jgi:AcrR family transcriptional regulator